MKKKIIFFNLFIFLIFSSLAFSIESNKGIQKVESQLLDKINSVEKWEISKDVDAVVIKRLINIDFEKDGSVVKDIHMIIKILTERGKKDLSSQIFPYHKRYTTVNINLARVIHPDGTYENVPLENIKDQTMAQTQQMRIFEENFRKKLVQFPSVSEKDTIEFIVRYVSKPLVKDNYTDLFLFQTFYPVKDLKVSIKGPVEKRLNYIVKNGELLLKKIENDNYITYLWEGKDIKALKREVPGMVSPFDVGLKLLISTFESWEELSKYGADLNKGKIDKTPEMVETVKKLTEDKETKKEKILSIFRYISKKIRYMGSSMDVGAFIEPHKASYTFKKQYGVCRDKSILMIAMLKIINIHAEDVMVSVSRRTDVEVPTIYFEHAIVGVEMEDGSFVYMDPTLELSSDFGEALYSNRYLLHLTEEGRDIIKNEKCPPEKSKGTIKAETEVLSDGSIESNILIYGTGTYDLILRQIGKNTPGQMQNFLWNKILQIMNKGTTVEKGEYGEPSVLDEQYTIKLKIKSPSFLEKLGDFYLMKIPQKESPTDLYYISVVKGFANLPEREYTVFVQSSFVSEIEEVINLPSEYNIKAVPDSFEFVEEPISLKVDIIKKDSKVVFKRKFRINKAYINPQEYKILRKAILRMDRFNKSFIILEKGEK